MFCCQVCQVNERVITECRPKFLTKLAALDSVDKCLLVIARGNHSGQRRVLETTGGKILKALHL